MANGNGSAPSTPLGSHTATVDEALAGAAFPVELDGLETQYLHHLLSENGDDEAASILAKLGFTLPKFEIGDKVTRWPESGNTQMFVVTGHRFVAPGVWTAWLEDEHGEHYGGIGEVYLTKVED